MQLVKHLESRIQAGMPTWKTKSWLEGSFWDVGGKKANALWFLGWRLNRRDGLHKALSHPSSVMEI